MDEKTKQMEDKRLMEFEGEISPALLERKWDILTDRRNILSQKIERVEKQQARQKYGDKTLAEIGVIWDGMDNAERTKMAYEIPDFRQYCDDREGGETWIEEILGCDFFGETQDESSPSRYFEEFAKSDSQGGKKRG